MSREFRDMLTKGGLFEPDSEGEIEQKARGMIPRGGSSKLATRLLRRGAKRGGITPREQRVIQNLGGRYHNAWSSAIPIRGGKRGQYLVRRGKYR